MKRKYNYSIGILPLAMSFALHSAFHVLLSFFAAPDSSAFTAIWVLAFVAGLWTHRFIQEYAAAHGPDDPILVRERSTYSAIGFTVFLLALAGLADDLRLAKTDVDTFVAELLALLLGAWMLLRPVQLQQLMRRVVPGRE